MKLRYTIPYVEDVPATLSFYKAAFGLETRMLHPANDYGELETGDAVLAFSSMALMRQEGRAPKAPNPDHPSFEIALETDDVARAHEKALTAGAIEVDAPSRKDWGQTVSGLSDPNGFHIALVSPLETPAD